MSNASIIKKYDIDGILLLDKPRNISSNGILQRVKRLFKAKKAGHTGSLDPLATGMLPICFGKATKLSSTLLAADKYYRVSATLGVRTTTGDAEGEVIARCDASFISRADIESAVLQFTGTIQQIPPMYSALKYQGKPLYQLARQGIEIPREPRTVHIHALHIEAFDSLSLRLFVHCSKGTYIRTLIEDIGQLLGCGAYVSDLRRLAVAPYQGRPMFTFETLEEIESTEGIEGLTRCLL